LKTILLLTLGHLSSAVFSQVAIKGPWKIACGASSSSAFRESSSFNVRYLSPRFKWLENETEEEEKNPEKFKNMRLMAELIYRPPLKTLCTGFNAQCRLIKYKRFSMELYGGLKLFFITGSDFAVPNSIAGRGGDLWYMNMGILWQLNLGIISPYADIGGDGIITVGTEFNLRSVYKRSKGRYKLD
jgi:hypothetical protein